MQVTLNHTDYWIEQGHTGVFCWSNSRNEEATRFFATPLEAQQDAIDWEAGRRERYEASEEEDADARNRYLNQRREDAREVL